MSEHPPDPAKASPSPHIDAVTYAREQVVPLYRLDEDGTPYERGMIRQVAAHWLAGYFAGRPAVEDGASDPALIQSDDPQPSIGSATPDPRDAVGGGYVSDLASSSASQRIREIREIGWPCLCAPALECFDRRDPSNQPIAAVEWCDNCTVAWLLQRSDQDAETIEAQAKELEALKREVHYLTSAGVIECAVRNPSVSEYMNHWEGRTLKAESALAAARQELADMDARIGGLANRIAAIRTAAEKPARDFNLDYQLGCFLVDLAAARLRATRQRTTNDRGESREEFERDRMGETGEKNTATRIGETASAPSPQHAATDRDTRPPTERIEMPKYIVALTVHVTVDAPNGTMAEQQAWEDPKKYLNHGRTITAAQLIRKVENT